MLTNDCLILGDNIQFTKCGPTKTFKDFRTIVGGNKIRTTGLPHVH